MSADMATDHVNGNGTEEPMDTTTAESRSEHFPALLEAGLPQQVAEKLDELYVSGEELNASFFFLYKSLIDCKARDTSSPNEFPVQKAMIRLMLGVKSE